MKLEKWRKIIGIFRTFAWRLCKGGRLPVIVRYGTAYVTAETVGSLRYWLFVTAGVLTHPQGQTTIKLAVPPKERDWWNRLWDKLLSPFLNCNAVKNRPPIP